MLVERGIGVEGGFEQVGSYAFSGGYYVFSVFLYRPDWLEWELSSETMADLARATYNYFNGEWKSAQ